MSVPQINAQRLLQVFQAVGYAVLQAQVVEDALGVHLALVYDLQPNAARHEAEAVLSTYSGMTLGQLISGAKNKPAFPADLADRLTVYKKERNWLVHHSRQEQRRATVSDADTAAFCERLTELGGRATDLQGEISALTERHLLLLGYAKDKIDAQARRIYAEWYGESEK